jgi:putative N6-adenine-specific DNA methylase
VQKLQPPAESGLLVINPPWGQRIDGDVNRIWRILGSSLRERFGGWRVAILLPNPAALSPLGLGLEQITTFSSGGTRIGLYGGEIG